MNQTIEEYNQVVTRCRELFEKKAKDYGTAWRVLRTSSLTDQIFIKAQRIRSIEEKGVAKVEEGVVSEWIGIINYCVMALIQLEKGVLNAPEQDETAEYILSLYDYYIQEAQSLMLNKNHDYDEAWRQMRVSSLTDIILMKLLRVKQIEDNEGKTLVSEGIAANYYDMINYAVFAMIKLTL